MADLKDRGVHPR